VEKQESDARDQAGSLKLSRLPKDWYAVVRIVDRKVIKATRNIYQAAEKLKAGTCYGVGPSEEMATLQALGRADEFMAKGYKPLT